MCESKEKKKKKLSMAIHLPLLVSKETVGVCDSNVPVVARVVAVILSMSFIAVVVTGCGSTRGRKGNHLCT